MGAVRPLTTAATLGGTGMIMDCRLQADSLDDVLSEGVWASENRHWTCCARLDDFNWVVPPYDPDMISPGRELVRRKSHIGWNWSTDFFCGLI